MEQAAAYIAETGASFSSYLAGYRKQRLKLLETQGPEHPDTAQSLSNLALLYRFQGKYAEAEALYKRSLEIYEKAVGPNPSRYCD